ncbi:uncharacterized protein LOC112178082 [Rosa chinensis]|uniref:uncharacterized protein LOC112178082 n=1 Tax=Rosa chinensis TaxID=74649 RepID=UPI000D08CED0|nr:uncharacterized protein LOC112178082 [Rosa chinensis]
MIFWKFLLLFLLQTLAFFPVFFDSHLLPWSLIIACRAPVFFDCTSWRFSVEANNVNPWKTIPWECVGYVKNYITSRDYGVDLERVYAESVELSGDGKDVWISMLMILFYWSFESFVKPVPANAKRMAECHMVEMILTVYFNPTELELHVTLIAGPENNVRTIVSSGTFNFDGREYLYSSFSLHGTSGSEMEKRGEKEHK